MPKHNITLLGAPSSGKTTFLGALNLALTRLSQDWQNGDHQGTRWNLLGANNASRIRLVQLTRDLAGRHFPPGTLGIEELRWKLVNQGRRPRPWWWRYVFWASRKSVEIGLELADPQGAISTDQRDHQSRPELIKNLMKSNGIIFLFDPVSEFDRGDTFTYIFGLIAELAQRMSEKTEFPDGYLPHHVAVCISKFDDVRVFKSAQQLELVSYDGTDDRGFPCIQDEDAREFLVNLCKVSLSGNAEYALDAIERNFSPERTKYFVTSAIGFYVDPDTDSFNVDDYQNSVWDLDDEQSQRDDKKIQPAARIRGPIYPINVVEPLLWLSGRLSNGSGR